MVGVLAQTPGFLMREADVLLELVRRDVAHSHPAHGNEFRGGRLRHPPDDCVTASVSRIHLPGQRNDDVSDRPLGGLAEQRGERGDRTRGQRNGAQDSLRLNKEILGNVVR